jgi:hypothetical protein
MKDTQFIVKVNRGGTRAAEYVKRIDRTPIQTTTKHLSWEDSPPKTLSNPSEILGAVRNW